MDAVRQRFGEFIDFFRSAVPEAQLVLADAIQGSLPDPKQVEAAIITGSPHSVTQPEAWTHALADWTRQMVGEARPLLGVCYGHQLMAWALGGQVEENVAGYEIGSIEVELTEAGRTDPLLGVLGESLQVQSTHVDTVTRLPFDAVVLGANKRALQAFRAGPRAWAVQFHPEFSADIMRAYVELRQPLLRTHCEKRGLNFEAELAQARQVKETPQGPALLRRFLALAEQT